MTDVEEDMLKNLIILLAKKIEGLNKTMSRLELSLKWFDELQKEIYYSMKFINNFIKENESKNNNSLPKLLTLEKIKESFKKEGIEMSKEFLDDLPSFLEIIKKNHRVLFELGDD